MVFVDDKAIAINALIDAVETIEREMGITPSGVYSDVRVRLDILEARINNPFAPAPNVENPFIIGNDGVTISTGTGYPTENRLPGSLYMRKDGYNNEGLYARRPDMMWHQIDTDPWTANRDLAGTIYSQTVIGLQDHDINSDASLLQTDAAGDGYVLTWNEFANAGNGWWEPQIGFFAFGDLAGTKINQTVVNLQGTPIVIGTMGGAQDGYSLIWNNTVPQWEPQRLAVVFDPLDDGTANNIRSNRYSLQSPIDNTKTGIVNLGSDTAQTTLGVQFDYGVILGGDQNEVLGDYGAVVSGLQNVVSDTYGVIVGGSNHQIQAGGSYSFIGGGSSHVVSGQLSVIGGGDTNIITALLSVIVGGAGNQVTGNFSSIVGGVNSSTDSDHTFIGGGASHVIGSSSYSSILGGDGHSITDGYWSAILSGQSNSIIGASSTFANILGGQQNTINTSGVAFTTILNGSQNTANGFLSLIGGGSLNIISAATNYGTVLNGTNSSVDGDFSTILSGQGNNIVGIYNTILNGLNNTISGGVSHNVVSGSGNTVAASFTVVAGLNNIVASGANNFVTIYGDVNVISSGSHYSGVWGCTNNVSDGYVALFGDHNNLNDGSTFADVHGSQNTINSSKYASIWGDLNTIGNNADYSAIFGTGNTVANGATYGYIGGATNIITANSTYSSAWGNNNNVTGNYTNVWGSFNTTTADWATVFGYYGKAVYPGQFSIAARSINGTVGASQYSKIIVDGAQAAGGQFDLKVPQSGLNVVLEDGKSYDITVRFLINNTNGSPTCARYVLDVLAHCESGTLTLDVVNTTIANDNGTGWTVSLLTSGNQLVVRVNSSGAVNRRAIATIDWRELSRL
jgi:hypothetical protein